VRRKRPSSHHTPAERAAIDAARYAAGAAAAWFGFEYLDYVCAAGATADRLDERWSRA
jgi:hypothetical protein